MTDEAELGFHARPFAIEHGIGVARRDVSGCSACTAEVDVAIAPPPVGGSSLPSPPSLGLRLFRLAQASTSVPSTEKC